jgi:hypothetical protein
MVSEQQLEGRRMRRAAGPENIWWSLFISLEQMLIGNSAYSSDTK